MLSILLALAAPAAAEGAPTADAGTVVGAFEDLCRRSSSFDQARSDILTLEAKGKKQ